MKTLITDICAWGLVVLGLASQYPFISIFSGFLLWSMAVIAAIMLFSMLLLKPREIAAHILEKNLWLTLLLQTSILARALWIHHMEHYGLAIVLLSLWLVSSMFTVGVRVDAYYSGKKALRRYRRSQP